MQINRLRIQNYRCYEDAEIELDRSLLLITGSNDGGKSALLSAIELFLYSRAKPDGADFRSLDAEGNNTAEEIQITAHVESDGEVTKRRRRFWREDGGIQWAYEVEKEVPKDEELRKELRTFKSERSAGEQRAYLGELGFDEFGSNEDKRYAQLEEYAEGAENEMCWIETSTPDLPGVDCYVSEEMGDPVSDVQSYLKDAVRDRIRELTAYANERVRS